MPGSESLGGDQAEELRVRLPAAMQAPQRHQLERERQVMAVVVAELRLGELGCLERLPVRDAGAASVA